MRGQNTMILAFGIDTEAVGESREQTASSESHLPVGSIITLMPQLSSSLKVVEVQLGTTLIPVLRDYVMIDLSTSRKLDPLSPFNLFYPSSESRSLPRKSARSRRTLQKSASALAQALRAPFPAPWSGYAARGSCLW